MALAICLEPKLPWAPYACVKLVADPVRLLLWLDRGEEVADRELALERGLELLPEEEPALREALALRRRLRHSPAAPLEESAAALVRLSAAVGRRLAADAREAGATGVRLTSDEGELALPGSGRGGLAELGGEAPPLPLVDWRALAWPLPPDEALASVPLDPSLPSDLAAAAGVAAAGPGAYPALRAGELVVLASTSGWLLRIVQCPVTDPVSFALLEGRDEAAFPELPGLCARDVASRAVSEHRAWLGLGDDRRPALRELMLGHSRATAPRLLSLARLFGAARAALFADSVRAGEPELSLTVAEVAARLGAERPEGTAVAEEAAARYRESRLEGGDPPEPVMRSFRELVLGLPPYRPDGWWTEAGEPGGSVLASRGAGAERMTG